MKYFAIPCIAAALAFSGLYAQEVTHGPWLFNPNSDSLSVGFTTDTPAGAGIELRKKGTEEWTKYYDMRHGRKFDRSSDHIINVINLEPGSDYEYKLIVFEPWAMEEKTLDQVYTFRTLPENPDSYQVFITSDLQFSNERRADVLKNLMSKENAEKSDYVFLIGDLANVMNNFETEALQGYIDPLVKNHNASARPVSLIRGNHEWRGNECFRWPEAFASPTGKTYYSFQLGEVLYIVLDCGEDKLDRTPGHWYTDFNASEQFRAEQRQWLEDFVQSDKFKNAKFRVVLAHSGPYAQAREFQTERMQELVKDLLNGTDAENRIHLWLAGHEHVYIRGTAGSDTVVTYHADDNNKSCTRLSSKEWNFTIAANDGPGYGGVDVTGMVMKVTPETITIRSYDEEGTVFDAFEITVDGNCKELLDADKLETFTIRTE